MKKINLQVNASTDIKWKRAKRIIIRTDTGIVIGTVLSKENGRLNIGGFPGKRGPSGYLIPEYVRNQQWQDMTSYCEGDVLNTWLVYLRYLLLKGQMSSEDHRLWIQATIHYLQGQPQQAEFLQIWKTNSLHTDFTSSDFSTQSTDQH